MKNPNPKLQAPLKISSNIQPPTSREDPNTKHRIPSRSSNGIFHAMWWSKSMGTPEKLQIPNPKLQAPTFEDEMSADRKGEPVRSGIRPAASRIGIWSLGFLWSLEL